MPGDVLLVFWPTWQRRSLSTFSLGVTLEEKPVRTKTAFFVLCCGFGVFQIILTSFHRCIQHVLVFWPKKPWTSTKNASLDIFSSWCILYHTMGGLFIKKNSASQVAKLEAFSSFLTCLVRARWCISASTSVSGRWLSGHTVSNAPPFHQPPPTCLSRAFTWADRRMEPGWVGEEKQSITPTVRLSESSRTLGLRFEESLRKIISRQETPVLLFSFRYEWPQIRVLT